MSKYTIPFALHVMMDFGTAADDVETRMDGHYEVNVYDPEESNPHVWGEINTTVFDKPINRKAYDKMEAAVTGPMEEKAISIAIRQHQAPR